MTETEWLRCSHPDQIWDSIFPWDLDDGDYPSQRKARLFACACWRRVWHSLLHPAFHRAIETAEGYAGAAWLRFTHWEKLRVQAEADVEQAVREMADAIPLGEECDSLLSTIPSGQLDLRDQMRQLYIDDETQALTGLRAAKAMRCVIENYGDYLDRYLVRSVGPDAAREGTHESADLAAQCDYLRCIFHPTPGGRPRDLAMTDYPAHVRSLAEAAYEHRLLPLGTLDPDRLAVLSDALEEAGCTDAALLAHLRSPSPHIRGCRPLDQILGIHR